MAYTVSNERLAELGIIDPLPKDADARRAILIKATGKHRSQQNRATETWWDMNTSTNSVIRELSIIVPFESSANKNARFRHNLFSNGMQNNEASIIFMQNLIDIIQSKNNGHKWFQGKTWLDIFVEKPDNRRDAVNFVDFICDAIKQAIGIDDRWFCIRSLDWSIVKIEPRILIRISQNIDCDYAACAYCGTLWPYMEEYFNGLGYISFQSRVCRECSSSIRGRYKRTSSDGTIVFTDTVSRSAILDQLKVFAEQGDERAQEVVAHAMAYRYGSDCSYCAANGKVVRHKGRYQFTSLTKELDRATHRATGDFLSFVTKTRHTFPKLISEEVENKIRDQFATGNFFHRELANVFKISQAQVSRIVNREPKIMVPRRSSTGKFAKINDQVVKEIRWKYQTTDITHKELAESYNISQSQICRIINYVRRKTT